MRHKPCIKELRHHMAECVILGPYHRNSYEMRRGAHFHILSVMLLHIYVFGNRVILSCSGINWMALWRKQHKFTGALVSTLVFGEFRWASSSGIQVWQTLDCRIWFFFGKYRWFILASILLHSCSGILFLVLRKRSLVPGGMVLVVGFFSVPLKWFSF